MIPITQTLFGKPKGNCFAACVASILEVPLKAIPNVAGYEDWYERINFWGRRHGIQFLCFRWSDDQKKYIRNTHSDAFLIVSGPAARGLPHACVFRGVNLVHDPHPDRTGLSEEPIDWVAIFISEPQKLETWRKKYETHQTI